RGDDERTSLLLSHGCERCIELAFVAGPNDKNFLPERMDSHLRGLHFDFAARMVWIHEISDSGSLRNELMDQLHSLSHRCRTKYGETGDIAAWPTEIRHQALADGVTISGEHDRNCLGCVLS